MENMIEKEQSSTKEEIHKEMEREYQFVCRMNTAQRESMKECSDSKIDIDAAILALLQDLGFDPKHDGTEYLVQVISDLYHERKVFEPENTYFDFADKKNHHYSFVNEYYECGLRRLLIKIDRAVGKSKVRESSMNEIVYGVVNDVISKYDESGRQLVYQCK